MEELITDLIVESGENKTISPRVSHVYENIIIKPNGVLFIESNSNQWCILIAKQSIIIDGDINFRNFKKSETPFIYKFPSGKSIEHTFSIQSIGGTGGNGGYSRGGSTISEGGRGAFGTKDYGGGGGSCGGQLFRDRKVEVAQEGAMLWIGEELHLLQMVGMVKREVLEESNFLIQTEVFYICRLLNLVEVFMTHTDLLPRLYREDTYNNIAYTFEPMNQ